MSFYRWLRNRESGISTTINDRDLVMRQIYGSMKTYNQWNDCESPNNTTEFGAIFNLEFSPDGSIVAAACEKKSVLLFDTITTNQTHMIPDAHTAHVNCIKFLDNRMFATCSDDTTIALWDIRCLKKKVRSLHGHSNWVKNVEYSPREKLLVTSGFDGSIFTWDVNSQTEQGFLNAKIFHTSGLMRCRLVPDGSKLVLCSTGGYLMVIHNLDLSTLHKDLCGFRPSIYRLMQMGHQYIPQAAKFDHVFSKRQKKNRVELVTDFPENDDAEVVFALQIHPKGHSILSRNISYDETTEWSCVHDIMEEPGDITDTININNLSRKRKWEHSNDTQLSNIERPTNANEDSDVVLTIHRRQRNQLSRIYGRGGASSLVSASVQPSTSGTAQGSTNGTSTTNRSEFVPDIWAAEVTVQERAIRQRQARSSHSVTGYNFVYAISSGVLPAAATSSTSNEPAHSRTTGFAGVSRRFRSNSPYSSSSTDSGSSTSSNSSTSRRPMGSTRFRAFTSMKLSKSPDRQIFQNPKKLMYYTEEPNKGKGFIKEPCFSADGRIVCSPYDTGVRLLAFNEDCSEYPHHSALNDRKSDPRKLVELCTLYSHPDIVLCTKFSPRHPLLVSGCRSGKISWHSPLL